MNYAEAAAWASAVAAGFAALATFAALFISWRQVEVAKRQLDVDLFDHRMAVFDLVAAVESEIFTHGSIRGAHLDDMQRHVQKVERLFGADVKEKYLTLIDQLIDWDTASATQEPGETPTMPERMCDVRQAKQELIEAISPYVDLHKGIGFRR